MKTNLDHGKWLFFVVGPPRSGTTIVASLFNSLEDGFCLGEPHWLHEAEGPDAVEEACGKMAEHWRPVGEYKLIVHANVLPMLALPGYRVGGYKETYQGLRHTCEPLLAAHLPLVDFFVVVLRDPRLVLSSLRALGWDNVRVRDVNQDYERMGELARKRDAVVVVLEDFVLDPLGYLNARLPFRIEGPLELKPTGHRFGDPAANEATAVDPEAPGRRVMELNERWCRGLAPAVRVWEEWKSKS
jgi:hypothetical protein